MGDFTDRISKRVMHTKVDAGYCLICQKYGKLSKDHVPPKCAITITPTEQRHIVEVLGGLQPLVKGVLSRSGSQFQTICSTCNNEVIGAADQEIQRLYKELTRKINLYFSQADSVVTTVRNDVDPIKYARAMIGHLLAATSSQECSKKPEESPYFKPLQAFVLGDNTALDNSHDIYYWFYPWSRHLSLKFGTFSHKGRVATVSLLSYFPVAFLITKKGEGVYPTHARILQFTDQELVLDLRASGLSLSSFPFHPLEEDQILALCEFQAICSEPKMSPP